jgi:hypothetical protein
MGVISAGQSGYEDGNHESLRTTGLYDRRGYEITLDDRSSVI